ncbi:MAG: IS66 family insertion sequence element accessory protein TnpB [Thermodesulfobacteriota bacterium]
MARPKDLEKRRFWGAQLRAWQRSGLTQAEFCRRQGLGRRLFSSWKRRLGSPERAAGGQAAPPVRFVPVAVRPEVSAPAPIATHPAAALTVVARTGHRIEVGDGFTPETLARLLATLERP